MYSSEYIANQEQKAAASKPPSPVQSFNFSVGDEFDPNIQSNSMAVYSLDSQDQLFQTTAGGGGNL